MRQTAAVGSQKTTHEVIFVKLEVLRVSSTTKIARSLKSLNVSRAGTISMVATWENGFHQKFAGLQAQLLNY